MFSSAFLTALALVAAPVFGAPVGVSMMSVEKYSGTSIKGDYIVTYKSGAGDARANMLSTLGTKVKANWPIMNAFASTLDADTLRTLRASPNVESIAEDGIYNIFADVAQSNAPWGISRLSQNAPLVDQDATDVNFKYTFDDTAGEGVDIYIIDTGIQTTHTQFQGRATWGATFGGFAEVDGNGHGTHCAGTAAGTRFGVAKSASLIAVKVIGDDGSGAISDIISGLNFARSSALESGRPSVASISLGGGASNAVDAAVQAATAAGVHVVVAAGNESADISTTSPARAASAITVGASDIKDAFASFSNFGTGVDIIAPGVDIISSSIGSDTALATLSGTSMSTPHVAGLVAYLLGRDGNSSPAAMSTKIKTVGVANAISGTPAGTTSTLASNDL